MLDESRTPFYLVFSGSSLGDNLNQYGNSRHRHLQVLMFMYVIYSYNKGQLISKGLFADFI